MGKLSSELDSRFRVLNARIQRLHMTATQRQASPPASISTELGRLRNKRDQLRKSLELLESEPRHREEPLLRGELGAMTTELERDYARLQRELEGLPSPSHWIRRGRMRSAADNPGFSKA